MPRKPAHLELAGGRSPRQRTWEMIRAESGDFTTIDVTPRGVTEDSVEDYLQALTNAGYLVVTRRAARNGTRQRWRLVKDPGMEAPRVRKDGTAVTQGQGNEAIWGAMQALGSFTTRVLAEMCGVNEKTVKAYVLMLRKAGYLTVEREDKHGGKKGIAIQAQYRLVKSRVHGPRPPMITRVRAVYDPNINQIVWQQSPDEVLAEAEAV
jgi:hypothetical protein